MDDTTDQFDDDDADARLEEPTETATGIVQDIPQTDAEIVSPLDVHVHHEVPRTQVPTLFTIPVSVIPESSPEVSNFAPPVIEKLIKESRDEVTLAKVSSQPQSTYEAASTLTEFELKRISSRKNGESGIISDAPEHQDLFKVADSDMPQDQARNLGDNEDEPRDETASRCDWFKKPTPPQEPTDPDWNVGKTTKEGPTQTWLMNLAASNPTDKSLKDFDELMSTPIDFSSFVLNGLKLRI
ncbi:hypothetical protein Tco_0278233 [Tanacetum coccineum]